MQSFQGRGSLTVIPLIIYCCRCKLRANRMGIDWSRASQTKTTCRRQTLIRTKMDAQNIIILMKKKISTAKTSMWTRQLFNAQTCRTTNPKETNTKWCIWIRKCQARPRTSLGGRKCKCLWLLEESWPPKINRCPKLNIWQTSRSDISTRIKIIHWTALACRSSYTISSIAICRATQALGKFSTQKPRNNRVTTRDLILPKLLTKAKRLNSQKQI